MKKKIAIIGFTGIGNVLMFLPTLMVLKKTSGNEIETLFLTYNKNFGEFLVNNNIVNRSILFIDPYSVKNKIFAFILRLINLIKILYVRTQQKLDTSFVPYANPSNYQAVISILLGAETKIIHSSVRLNRYLKKNVNLLPVIHDKHDVEQNLIYFFFYANYFATFDKIKMIDVFAINSTGEVDINRLLEENEKILKIIIHPRCKFNDSLGTRDWNYNSFASLMDFMMTKLKKKIIFFLIGSSSDEPELRKIKETSKAKSEIFINKNFSDLIYLFSKCESFIGVDSSMGHLAAFTKIKIFTLLGPTDPIQITPFSKNSTAISIKMPCSPCYLSKFQYNCPHQSCLNDMTPVYVSDIIVEHLNIASFA